MSIHSVRDDLKESKLLSRLVDLLEADGVSAEIAR
jgi:hypothetical protein